MGNNDLSENNAAPECGFIEKEDGSIVWGRPWEARSYDPEPVVVEYREVEPGVWVPHQAWVKDDRGYVDMHDCDWVASESRIYHHFAGLGSHPYVHRFAEPQTAPARIWIADGYHVVEASSDGSPLADDDLRAMGIIRVMGPTPAPFAGGVEDETVWCEQCQDNVPDDDTYRCCVCSEKTHVHQGSLVAIFDPGEGCLDSSAGVYKVMKIPIAFGGMFRTDAIERVGDLPAKADSNGYAGSAICSSCSSELRVQHGDSREP